MSKSEKNIRMDVIEKFLDTEVSSEEEVSDALKMLNKEEQQWILNNFVRKNKDSSHSDD